MDLEERMRILKRNHTKEIRKKKRRGSALKIKTKADPAEDTAHILENLKSTFGSELVRVFDEVRL